MVTSTGFFIAIQIVAVCVHICWAEDFNHHIKLYFLDTYTVIAACFAMHSASGQVEQLDFFNFAYHCEYASEAHMLNQDT